MTIQSRLLSFTSKSRSVIPSSFQADVCLIRVYFGFLKRVVSILSIVQIMYSSAFLKEQEINESKILKS